MRSLILWSLLGSAFALPQDSSPAAAAPVAASCAPSGVQPLDDVTVYRAGPSNREMGVFYARSIQLEDGTLLATSEDYTPEPPVVRYPIYRSTDFGRTWSYFSTIDDTHRGIGGRYQPQFFVLLAAVGAYPRGTILFCGNFIPSDLSSTHLDIYASRDKGKTWTFVTNVASGGVARPNNGETPVWEPHFVYHNKVLGVFYADQRDPLHGQKCSLQTTKDLVTWSPVSNAAAYANYADRPGMPVVAKLANGKWMLVYEYVGAPEGNAPAYYKIANDPWSFENSTGVPLIAPGNRRPQSSPYIVVTSTGRIIVSGGQTRELFINDQNGDANSWRSLDTYQPSGYTRHLQLITNKKTTKQWLQLTSAGWFNNEGQNRVSVGIIDPAFL